MTVNSGNPFVDYLSRNTDLPLAEKADDAVYVPRAIKRKRRTKAEMEAICDAIFNVLKATHPQTVRHVYYVITGQGLILKTEAGYQVIKRKSLDLRKVGRIPWTWISDGTRWRRVAATYDSPAEAVRATARHYRRDLWRRTPVYVEVWCESDSMAGVIIQETERYDVPLMVSRGFSSKAYLYRAAEEIKEQGRPAYLYYVGDWDPSGKLIPEDIERTLREFAPDSEIHFERLLITPEQIRRWRLPTKPPKKSTHSRGFEGGTVEAEALPVETAQRLVREAIEQHLDMDNVKVMRVAEESEAEYLNGLANAMEAA